MLTVKREVQVLRKGDETCSHSMLTDGFWHGLNVFSLSHTQEKICFNCGHYERVTTSIVRDNPFTFDAVANRFSK
jgi:hypothetical protein